MQFLNQLCSWSDVMSVYIRPTYVFHIECIVYMCVCVCVVLYIFTQSLQSVTVSNNAITSIDTGLFTLNSLLKTADLSYNLLTTINSIGGPIQTTLNLANNRITCKYWKLLRI